VLTDYVITEQDVAGPFTPPIPKDDYEAMAKLPALGYGTPLEMLAERFHMDEPLLQALNPGVDFGRPGPRSSSRPWRRRPGRQGHRIEIDNAKGQAPRLCDGDKSSWRSIRPRSAAPSARPRSASGRSTPWPRTRPTPTTPRLTFGKPKGKLTIKAGPNNPVGSTWIDLTKDTYGIHGTPDPKLVNKRASHGCVRLTNWDAAELGSAVKKGAKVVFMGAEARAS
jgi:lipoprotein-anchoring transpeptidase ErfK/SrfK